MRAPQLKTAILRMAGKGEFYGYEMHKKLDQRKISIGIGRLYSILSEMKKEGLLKDRWEKSHSGPKRRVYRTSKKGDAARDRILVEAIKTVHEFYTEYLFSLPPKHSAFNMVSKMILKSLPKTANVAYAASRFTGPVRKLIENLLEKIPEGNLYAIHPKDNKLDLEMADVSIVDGTIEDIPMKEDYLDLLVVTGELNSDSLDSCLGEWQRVIGENGTLAIVTPSTILAKYEDPLDIGEFIEQREHQRLDSSDHLDLEILTKEMRKYFERVDVKKVIHITVLRGSNPLT